MVHVYHFLFVIEKFVEIDCHLNKTLIDHKHEYVYNVY